MKKSLTVAAVALLIGGTAMAEAMKFSFGTNFYKPNDARYQTSQGTSFLLSWAIDNDIEFGVLNENSTFFGNANAGPDFGTLGVTGIRVSKGVVKMVTIGLGLGVATLTDNSGNWSASPVSAPAVDIVGAVNILSGKGDKVSGSLDAIVSARFINLTNAAPGLTDSVGALTNFDGTNLGLAVTVGF